MSVPFAELEPVLRNLLAAQLYAVLGTQGVERINLNLMALAATDDLRSLVLATERATAKYVNLLRNPKVSLLVDNRTNQAVDIHTTWALTIDGLAEEVVGIEKEQLAACLLARHPQLEPFVRSPNCALFRIRVERYELVHGLYDVREARLS